MTNVNRCIFFITIVFLFVACNQTRQRDCSFVWAGDGNIYIESYFNNKTKLIVVYTDRLRTVSGEGDLTYTRETFLYKGKSFTLLWKDSKRNYFALNGVYYNLKNFNEPINLDLL